MASPIVLWLTKAQVEFLLQDRRKAVPRWRNYRVASTLRSKGLVEEHGERWRLTVPGIMLNEFLRHWYREHQA